MRSRLRLPQMVDIVESQPNYRKSGQDRWCDNLGGAVRIGDDFDGYSTLLEVLGCCALRVGELGFKKKWGITVAMGMLRSSLYLIVVTSKITLIDAGPFSDFTCRN